MTKFHSNTILTVCWTAIFIVTKKGILLKWWKMGEINIITIKIKFKITALSQNFEYRSGYMWHWVFRVHRVFSHLIYNLVRHNG